MPAMRKVIALILGLLPVGALAAEGDLLVQLTGPTNPRLDCDEPSDTCMPLNGDICFVTVFDDREIEATVARAPNITVPPDSKLFVWLNSEDPCTFDTKPETPQLIVDGQVISAGSPLIATNSFRFPDDVDVSDASLIAEELITASGAAEELGTESVCDEDGNVVPVSFTYRLCFAIDLNDPTLAILPDNKIVTSEPQGFVEIRVDSIPPEAPTVTNVLPLDGSVQVSAESDGNIDDISRWVVRYRRSELAEPPADISTEASDCFLWESYTDNDADFVAGGELQLATELENGVLWEGCVFLVDRVGNIGPPSATFYSLPTNQCDFIECYPGDLEPGYCGAGGAAWPVVLLAGALLALRRRGRRS